MIACGNILINMYKCEMEGGISVTGAKSKIAESS